MTRITVVGGTGYAGGHIVGEAARRGHTVVSYSRSAPSVPVEGVEYRQSDLSKDVDYRSVVDDADVVISALSPRGDLSEAGLLRKIDEGLAQAAKDRGVRLGVVGGAGSLLVFDGGPALADTDGFPDGSKAEAAEMGAVLDDLKDSDVELDWFYISPAAGFGSWAPGEATGAYRIGGEVLLVNESGASDISGADFALAVLDEVEHPAHVRQRFAVAY